MILRSSCPLCAQLRAMSARHLSISAPLRAAPTATEIPAHILEAQRKELARQEALRYKRPKWTGTLAAGTPLGFKVFKDEPAPTAKEDKEYPAWLWQLLDKPAFDGDPQIPGQVNRRDPLKEIRRQLDKERSDARHLARQSKTL